MDLVGNAERHRNLGDPAGRNARLPDERLRPALAILRSRSVPIGGSRGALEAAGVPGAKALADVEGGSIDGTAGHYG